MSFLASLGPVLSCAVCPACIALWKPLLSVVGVSLALGEGEHLALLIGSLAIALGVAAYDVWRWRLWSPFWPTLFGAGLMVASHALGDWPALEWAGVAVMASAVFVRARLRSRRVRAT